MAAVARFLFLAALKLLSRVFYRFETRWVGHHPKEPFAHAQIFILLNHTSLFEPVFTGVLPWSFLWRVARRGVLPGADSTLDRPIVGRLFKAMAPGVLSVTRNRDRSWREFIDKVTDDAIIVMAPEGRMKRRTGLDKYGKPMTVRGGIADVLAHKHEGTMVILYSEGLHHVQAPGERPKVFETIRLRLEEVRIAAYKSQRRFTTTGFRERIMADLERRRDLHCQEA